MRIDIDKSHVSISYSLLLMLACSDSPAASWPLCISPPAEEEIRRRGMCKVGHRLSLVMRIHHVLE
jgi:hypothetical protein